VRAAAGVGNVLRHVCRPVGAVRVTADGRPIAHGEVLAPSARLFAVG
jgi:hypothetical protein